MPFETTKQRNYWRAYYKKKNLPCAHCGVEVIWDRKVAHPHGKSGTISDRAANVDHIIPDKNECARLGITYSSVENLQVLCRKCNYAKNKRSEVGSTKFTGNLMIT